MPSSSTGYSKSFLGRSLAFPKLNKDICVPLSDGSGYEIKYTHFSVFLHQERRLPYLAAVNIKGEAYNAPSRAGDEPWDYASQVAKEYQLDNDFYGKDDNTFDRGHIVRRVDPCWGTTAVSEQAEIDTFHWVNCTPQHKKLNQKGGVWYQLEQHVIENGVKDKLASVSVFAGPVLDPKDLPFKKKYHNTLVKVPISFWKVIVWKKSDGNLYAVGFMMSQWEFIKDKLIPPVIISTPVKKALPDDYFENLQFADHKTYQVSLSTIEKATGIKFNWTNVKFPFKAKPKVVKATPLKQVHRFSQVFSVFKKVAAVSKKNVDVKAIRAEVGKIDGVPEKKINELVNKGDGFLLKRYQLNNITL
jgi:endonuclease G